LPINAHRPVASNISWRVMIAIFAAKLVLLADVENASIRHLVSLPIEAVVTCHTA